MTIEFFRATTPAERAAINQFLARHNPRGTGSTRGYVAYYAAVQPSSSERSLAERLVAAAKLCPLHTPQAARFFAGEDWRHVYCLQRLAAHGAPENLLSRFLAWVLREAGKDERLWYVATYADPRTFNSDNGRPHDGGIYRATNAIYCGRSAGGVEGFVKQGQRCSMRCGPKTHTLRELNALNTEARLAGRPEPIQLIRTVGLHRYAWAVARNPLALAFRRRELMKRMTPYHFVPVFQPRLLARLLQLLRRWGVGSRASAHA